MAKRMLTGCRDSAKLVVAATCLLAACGGGSYGSSPTPTLSVPPTATARVSIQQPTATATVEPPAAATDATLTVPTATATEAPSSIAPPTNCGGPRYRLNIDKLRAQPAPVGAIVTAVDKDTVMIDIDGIRFSINGWGKSITIGVSEKPPGELFEQVVAATDAVRYEC